MPYTHYSRLTIYYEFVEVYAMLYIYPVSSPICQTRNKIIESMTEKLQSRSIEFKLLHDIHNRKNPFAFLILTGGSEHEVMSLIKHIEDPVLLIAHPEENSFPASLEILAKLSQMNRKGKIILINEQESTFEELKNTIKIMETAEKLKYSKIGLIGHPSRWLVASSPGLKIINRYWGPEIIKISIKELIEETEHVSEEEARIYAEEFLEKGEKTIEPDMNDIIKAVKIYIGTKKIVGRYNLRAVTMECFKLLNDLNSTGCYAMSKLNDEGIIAGCEGDIPGTLTMVWMYYLTGEIPFMANPQDIDIDNNIVRVAHCTIARKLLTGYIIRSHFESSIGVALQGKIKNGPVTLGRIGGEDLRKVSLTNGTIVACEGNEKRCRTQLKLKLEDSVRYFLKNPLANHHIIIRGHHTSLLAEYYNFMIQKQEI